MKRLIILAIASTIIFSCSDNNKPANTFSPDELSPVFKFTYNNKTVEIVNSNCGCWWSSDRAQNIGGPEMDGLMTKAFGSMSGAQPDDPDYAIVEISRWVSDDDIDFTIPIISIDVVKTSTFQDIFKVGSRLYARGADPIQTTDEVVIQYTDEDKTEWSSSYMGNYYATPSYNTLQPSSNFEITRSLPIGSDSVFIEARFKARLYKNTRDYIDVTDGYFKGYFKRR